MDFRNSGLIIGVYVLLGIVVGGLAWVSLLLVRRESQTLSALQLKPDLPTRGNVVGRPHDAYFHQRQEAFAEAAQRIKQLEVLLQRKTDLLNRRTELLHQRSKEYDALRAEADRYLMALVDELSQQPLPATSEGATPAPRPNLEARAAMQVEMNRLREELERSELAERALEAELELVRQELLVSRDRLTDAELRELVGDEPPDGLPLATEALVRVGNEAVAVLMVSLRDERADVRLWAVEVLAEMGPVARPAAPALQIAAQDTDSRVSTAARRALTLVNMTDP